MKVNRDLDKVEFSMPMYEVPTLTSLERVRKELGKASNVAFIWELMELCDVSLRDLEKYESESKENE